MGELRGRGVGLDCNKIFAMLLSAGGMALGLKIDELLSMIKTLHMRVNMIYFMLNENHITIWLFLSFAVFHKCQRFLNECHECTSKSCCPHPTRAPRCNRGGSALTRALLCGS
jgi:hypothetical protein